LLLRNLDAETVIISADHGNAVGEWGVYGHPVGFPHPAVKRVPWVETEANDSHGHTPKIQSTASSEVETKAKERLRDLGYL